MNKKLFLTLLVFVFSSAIIYAQRTVTGTVVDEGGIPLAGASVIVKGTTTGASTDFDGNFSINIESDSDVLVVSYVGYKTEELTVGSQTVINVTLSEDAESLGEVVITALGFAENRDEQGSTSSLVEAETVLRSGEATLANSLSGKASGLKISRSNGDPGAGSTIRIRGANTI